MSLPTPRHWILALTLLAAAVAAAPDAAAKAKTKAKAQSQTQPQDARAKLAAVRARIAELTRRRAQDLAERDALGARLRDAELEVTAKRHALEELQAATTQVAQRRSELQGERQRARTALDGERVQLAAEIRTAAMLGRQQELKMLLNQTDARRLGRMLTLEGYLGRARAARVAAIGSQLQALDALTAQIDAQSERYQALVTEAARELQELLQARAARAALLANLAGQVQSADQELARLRREEQAVESLLAELADALQDFPTDP